MLEISVKNFGMVQIQVTLERVLTQMFAEMQRGLKIFSLCISANICASALKLLPKRVLV